MVRVADAGGHRSGRMSVIHCDGGVRSVRRGQDVHLGSDPRRSRRARTSGACRRKSGICTPRTGTGNSGLILPRKPARWKHTTSRGRRLGANKYFSPGIIQDVVYNHYYDLSAERAQWQYDSTRPDQNIYYWYEGQPSDHPNSDGGYLNNGSSGYTPRFWEEVVRHQFISSRHRQDREDRGQSRAPHRPDQRFRRGPLPRRVRLSILSAGTPLFFMGRGNRGAKRLPL